MNKRESMAAARAIAAQMETLRIKHFAQLLPVTL